MNFSSPESDLALRVPDIIPFLKTHRIAGLVGDLGAGKTSLVKAICHHLGCFEASSPTFSIINEYNCLPNGFGIETLIHMDLYRLNTLDEALEMGIEEYLYSGEILLIEWPNILGPLLDKVDYFTIEIHPVDDHNRMYTISH